MVEFKAPLKSYTEIAIINIKDHCRADVFAWVMYKELEKQNSRKD
jgi:hypothetical protein